MKDLIKKWEESTLTELEVGTLVDQLLTNRSESIPISKIEELIKKYSFVPDGYGGVLETIETNDLQKLIDKAKHG